MTPHINSVTAGPSGDFVLSSREHSQIVSLSSDLRAVKWRLGGADGDFAFPDPDDRFYGQHTATELPSGNVLLFDNGWKRPEAEGGEYSRALELRLDHRGKRAAKVWEHRAGVYSKFMGSAYRLSNGNTLVSYGWVDSTASSIAWFEVDPEGREVFEFRRLPVRDAVFRRYRVQALSSIGGETMLRAPTARRVRPSPSLAYREVLARQPDVHAAFDLHVRGGELFYVREPCSPEDVASPFLLHVFPADPADLPEGRRGLGFESRDFHFDWRGVFADGVCATRAPLPDYPLARVRTGQYRPGQSEGPPLWQVEFAADRAALAARLDAALEAVAGRAPAASGAFDVHLDGRRLVYVKAPCEAEDVAARFFLRVVPKDPADLPAERAGSGFEPFNFDFPERGALRAGRCAAAAPLPEYAVARVYTGQWIRGRGELWRAEIPAAGAGD